MEKTVTANGKSIIDGLKAAIGYAKGDRSKGQSVTLWPAVGDEYLLRECQTYLLKKHNYGRLRRAKDREALLDKLHDRLGDWQCRKKQ